MKISNGVKISEILNRIKEQNFSYISPKLQLGKSSVRGKGVFAKKPIKKEEIINISGGIIVNEKEYQKLSKKLGNIVRKYTTEIEDNFYLLSAFQKDDLELDDFFNHSCNPNAGFKGQIIMVAMRNIKPGEEITYDYAMTDSDPEDYFKCNCGAKNCRKVITGNDWKKPSLQTKYRSYFSFYIQEKIKKLKRR